MPAELRKRKAPAAPAPVPEKPSKAAKGGGAVAKVTAKAKAQVAKLANPAPAATSSANGEGAPEPAPSSSSKPSPGGGKPTVGHVLGLEGFGGEIYKNDGEETSLKALVGSSKAGVCIFTYPKASTGGCTKQACLFRDSYESLTAAGLGVYGLSGDSLKANTNFKEKQHLPYPLLCDPGFGLIGALGFKRGPKSTARGVFVIDRAGKVLALEPGGPDATLAVAKRVADELASGSGAGAGSSASGESEAEGGNKMEVEEAGGAEVADGVDDSKEEQAGNDEAKAGAGANGGGGESEDVAANGPNGDSGAETE